ARKPTARTRARSPLLVSHRHASYNYCERDAIRREGAAICAARGAMDFAAARARLVDQLRAEGIADEAVLAAIGRVPRERFIPPEQRDHAYENTPLPIGEGQTISQPFVVALMTSALRLHGGERALEIGTGSGYQAAVLAELGVQLITLERFPDLA